MVLFDLVFDLVSILSLHTDDDFLGSGQTTISGLFQCRGDLSNVDCYNCVSKLPILIDKLCGKQVAARVQLIGCYMLYEVAGFAQVSGLELLYKTCSGKNKEGAAFKEKRDTALSQMENGIGGSNRFYVTSYESVYALRQCEGDFGTLDCGSCIKIAVQKVQVECGSSVSGIAFLHKCFVSYNYGSSGVPKGLGSGSSSGSSPDSVYSPSVYPKVKVKEQEQDDLLPVNLRTPLKDCDYFSTYDFNSPVSEYEDDSPTSVVRIPDNYVSSVPQLSQGEAKSRNNKKPAKQNFTQDIKVSPIPPPRAVLSSPDNDGLMRSKHKGRAEMVSGAEDHNLCKNRHVRCKETPRLNSIETTKITKQEPKETRDTNSNPKEKTKAGVADAKQRVCARKKKPDWVSPYVV